MILPVKFLWEQLDGPQITAIENALFQYFKDIFDTKLDYLSTMNVDTANDSHLTFLGILANFVRPVITVPDREFFYFTNEAEHGSAHGFAEINDRAIGGRFVGPEGVTSEARPINTEHYRILLKSYIEGDGELGSLTLLDDICYALSVQDQPTLAPSYRFEFMEGDNIPTGRAPGDMYIDIGTMEDWNNPLQIYAILRGLGDSTYWPVPQLFISIDATITVPTVTANLPGGTYTGPQSIELYCSKQGAVIHYTTDGSTPSLDTEIYIPGNPIKISSSTLIRARAYAPGYANSKITEFNYIIE